MKQRSELFGWLWGLILALPAAGLLLAHKTTEGLLAAVSFWLLLVYVAAMIVVGLRLHTKSYQEMQDHRDDRESHPDQDG